MGLKTKIVVIAVTTTLLLGAGFAVSKTVAIDGFIPSKLSVPGASAITEIDINTALDMRGNQIRNVGKPDNPTDAATKNYVDRNSLGGGGGTRILEDILEVGGNAQNYSIFNISDPKDDTYIVDKGYVDSNDNDNQTLSIDSSGVDDNISLENGGSVTIDDDKGFTNDIFVNESGDNVTGSLNITKDVDLNFGTSASNNFYTGKYDSGNTQFLFSSDGSGNIFTVNDGSQTVDFKADIQAPGVRASDGLEGFKIFFGGGTYQKIIHRQSASQNLVYRDFDGDIAFKIPNTNNPETQFFNGLRIDTPEDLKIESGFGGVLWGGGDGYRLRHNPNDNQLELQNTDSLNNMFVIPDSSREIQFGATDVKVDTVTVNDVLEVQQSSLPTCDSSTEGDIRYNGTGHYGCDGNVWSKMY